MPPAFIIIVFKANLILFYLVKKKNSLFTQVMENLESHEIL